MTLDEAIIKLQNLRVNAGRGDIVLLDSEGWLITGAELITMQDEDYSSLVSIPIGEQYVEIHNFK